VPARQDLEIDEATVLGIADGALRGRRDDRDPLVVEGEPRRRSGMRQSQGDGDAAGRVGLADGIDRVARTQRIPRREFPGHAGPGGDGVEIDEAAGRDREPHDRERTGPGGRARRCETLARRRDDHRLGGLEGQRRDAAALEQDRRREGLEREEQAAAGPARRRRFGRARRE
jgi:hypothetical protein